MKKRKDLEGRLLKDGETYRKSDNLYTFRYKDGRGVVKAIYNRDLDELRKQEEVIQKLLSKVVDYSVGMFSVIELVERYISLKKGVRYNTKVGYSYVLNILKKDEFGSRKIFDIKPSDAQGWFIKLHDEGKSYSTITSIRGVLRPAFQMAFDDEVIKRNPFDFVVTKYIPNDTKRRDALTPKEQKMWMDFIKNDDHYYEYYDEFVVLLGTGMRVSEFCGLTLKDLDFQGRRIIVDHQLGRDRHGKYYVEKTKTESGRRLIPMTNDVYTALRNIVKKRPVLKEELMVDGYAGFLLIDCNDHPMVGLHLENKCRWAMKKYKTLYPDKPLPIITPHVFRHTFCTNMVNAGMDVKVLQYIMGHSDVQVTLNVYTHLGYEKAAGQMIELVDGLKNENRLAY